MDWSIGGDWSFAGASGLRRLDKGSGGWSKVVSMMSLC